ncbi:MAG: rhodanese-like domain-containing protein, partial [Polyangiales bacterium]
FALGHIPGARRVYRGDYSSSDEVPGLSRSAGELERMLRDRGVDRDSTVVLYGDGGPEPYRLWWTLKTGIGFETRVLDGGLQAWKAAGHHVAGGSGLEIEAGDVAVRVPASPPAQRWPQTSAFLAAHPGARLLDTRSSIEFDGSEKHPKAARAGHIPGAVNLDWAEVLRDKGGDHRLRSPDALRALFAYHGVEEETPVLTYCQSGTRSAAVYFALHQLGLGPDEMLNYDGSWAEYSRLGLPVEP